MRIAFASVLEGCHREPSGVVGPLTTDSPIGARSTCFAIRSDPLLHTRNNADTLPYALGLDWWQPLLLKGIDRAPAATAAPG
jgi:hypothetical protein